MGAQTRLKFSMKWRQWKVNCHGINDAASHTDPETPLRPTQRLQGAVE
jgi:hypothetical protein